MIKCLLIDIPTVPVDNKPISENEKKLRKILSRISSIKNDDFWHRKKKKSYSRGMLSIASAIKKDGHEVYYYKLESQNLSNIYDIINKSHICGISAATPFLKYAYEVSVKLKKINPSIRVVFGGPHATFAPRPVINQNSNIDIVIRGSGELAMRELCNGISQREISNCCYIHNGNIHVGRIMPFNKDTYFSPDYSVLKDSINNYRINLQTTIGCSNNCSFCSNGTRQVVKIPIEKIIDEWKQIKDINKNTQIHFCDTNFLYDLEHAKMICSLIPSYFPESTKFSCDIRGDTKISSDILNILEKVGFKRICIGIETSSNYILKMNDKNCTYQKTIKTIKFIKNNSSINVYGYWMIGMPYQTVNHIRKDIETAVRLIESGIVDELSASISFIPLPGSKVYSNPDKYHFCLKKEKYVFGKLSWEENLYESCTIKKEHLIKLKEIYFKKMISAYNLRYKNLFTY